MRVCGGCAKMVDDKDGVVVNGDTQTEHRCPPSRPAAPSGLRRYRCDGPIFDEHNVPRYVDGEWLHRQADVDAELAQLRAEAQSERELRIQVEAPLANALAEARAENQRLLAERDEALAWRDTRHAYHVFKTTHDKLAQAVAEHQQLRERVEQLQAVLAEKTAVK